MTVQEIKDAIGMIDDLKQLDDIYQWVKRRFSMQSDMIEWKVGQEVRLKPEFQSRKPYDAIGVIRKVNQVKCKVEYINNMWNIPKMMLQPAL